MWHYLIKLNFVLVGQWKCSATSYFDDSNLYFHWLCSVKLKIASTHLNFHFAGLNSHFSRCVLIHHAIDQHVCFVTFTH